MQKIYFRGGYTSEAAVTINQGSRTLKGKRFDSDLSFLIVGTGDISVRAETHPENGLPRGISPRGFFFTVDVEGFISSDPNWDAWKDLHYTWSFSDPGWYTRHRDDSLPWGRYYEVNGEAVLVKDGTKPSGGTFLGNDKNIAYGPWVCHVFDISRDEFAGADGVIRTVTCEVRSAPTSEPLLTITQDVWIDNPDVIFSGNRTALVHPTADTTDRDAPEWDLENYPDAVLANSQKDGIDFLIDVETGRRTPKRVLFARGADHSVQSSYVTFGEGREPHTGNLQIGAYGEGSPPLLSSVNFDTRADDRGDNNGLETSVWGLDRVQNYDPADPVNTNPYNTGTGIRLFSNTYKTCWDLKIEGFHTGISGDPDVNSPGFNNFIAGNTYIGSWFDYGMFVHKSPNGHGQCGVFLKQKEGTVKGEGKTEDNAPFAPDHGPQRCTNPGSPTAYNLVDYRSLNSWAGFIQPCHRWNIAPVHRDREYTGSIPSYNFDRARFEGGMGIFQSDSANDPGGWFVGRQSPVRALYDKILSIIYIHNDPAGLMRQPGVVARNTAFIVPDQEDLGGNGNLSNGIFIVGSERGDVHLDKTRTTEDFNGGSYEVYNCGFYDMRTTDKVNTGSWDDFIRLHNTGEASVLLHNNAFHAPNRTDISADAGPLDMTVMAPTSFDRFRVIENGSVVDYESKAVPEDTVARFVPLSGSPSINAADVAQRVAVDDFFGRIRTGSPSLGPLEPDAA